MKPILIRADAGGRMGTGHVMRMIALAQTCLRRGGEVTIASVSCPPCLVERITACGISHSDLSANVAGGSEDSEATISLAREIGADWLVVDGYHFGYDYQKRIKKADLALLCVDDHGYSDRWCCDAILNQNLDAERSIKYQNDFVKPKILAGASFCLLREEFLKDRPSRAKWGRIERLLVTLGGSDPENATKAVLELLNQACARSLSIRILAGADNQNVETLRSSESHHQVEVVQNASNMLEQYAWADGIISAGGSTCWEWLYLGLPGAIVTIANNQCPIVRALTEERRAALSLGLFNGSSFGANTKQLSKWIDTPAALCEAPVATGIIDGFGANRVAGFLSGSDVMVSTDDEIIKKSRPVLRDVSLKDEDILFKWANDPDIRKYSCSKNRIPLEEHKKWLKKKLSEADCLFLMMMFDDCPAGVFRLDYQSDEYVISYSLGSQHRGKGLGRLLLSSGIRESFKKDRIGAIVGYVAIDNKPSLKLFRGLGFTEYLVGNKVRFKLGKKGYADWTSKTK
ncbi:UDP-2,4-diacetamido-2,4,6-trideoxy-beta-L-altropyranose hydrolase, partial [Akkermansiaceae bacterium]|nr:UDP-2,4-diacetamido-2,4,6-trideoxy-beta-L-altropyranose hydrolase [Akkermansiaceae bacterium]